jgi:hypothetical protein
MRIAQTCMVSFRGGSVEVAYEDMGPEPDCNAHVIEWSFASGFHNNHIVLSEEEIQSIYDQLKERADMADASMPEPEE